MKYDARLVADVPDKAVPYRLLLFTHKQAVKSYNTSRTWLPISREKAQSCTT